MGLWCDALLSSLWAASIHRSFQLQHRPMYHQRQVCISASSCSKLDCQGTDFANAAGKSIETHPNRGDSEPPMDGVTYLSMYRY